MAAGLPRGPRRPRSPRLVSQQQTQAACPFRGRRVARMRRSGRPGSLDRGTVGPGGSHAHRSLPASLAGARGIGLRPHRSQSAEAIGPCGVARPAPPRAVEHIRLLHDEVRSLSASARAFREAARRGPAATSPRTAWIERNGTPSGGQSRVVARLPQALHSAVRERAPAAGVAGRPRVHVSAVAGDMVDRAPAATPGDEPT
jgi:hypothetical protein